jgi:hypothetical protein
MDLIEGGLSNPAKHWYYAHKLRSIVRLVSEDLKQKSSIIDVGAGSALFSRALLKDHPNLTAVAIDTGYDFMEKLETESRIVYKNSSSGVSGDLYLFTDVLEHVPNDVLMLKDYVLNAPTGSKFVVTVPAFMSLWSGHDIFLKHYRRYKKSEINIVIESSGLRILKSQYLYGPLFPIAWILRKLPKSNQISSQMKNHGIIINKISLLILNLDFYFSKILPFGISIIILAEKA